MLQRTFRTPVLALLALAACEQSPTGAGLQPSDAETTVTLSAAAPGASLAPSFSLSGDDGHGRGGSLSLSDIKAINVRVTKVQVMRADSARPDSVIVLNVTGGGKINLLALPTDTAKALQLARGTLPAGTYSNLRLAFDSATIVLNRDITVGGGKNAVTFKKDSTYALGFGDDKGTGWVKLPTGRFTVGTGTGATVKVAFSGTETVRKVIVTPEGFKVIPVLSAKGESGKDKGKGQEKKEEKGNRK